MRTIPMKKSILAFSLSLSIFGSANVFAEQDTLKAVAQKAITTNPEVLQRWHAYQASVYEKDAARGAYLPRVDLNANAGRQNRDDPLLKENFSSSAATISLTQMLYDGFATQSEVARLDHTRQARFFELLDASESAALEATRAYLDVLRYRKLVSLAEENYVRHRTVFEQIQKKAQAGVSRKVDFEQASGRLALAESNLLVETANLHDVSARYQRLIGNQPAKDIASPPVLNKGLPADSVALLKASEQSSPAIQASIESLRATYAAKEARKSAFHPKVDLRLRDDLGKDLNGYNGRTNNKTAEIVMSWNLFNGFSDDARSKQYTDLINVAKDIRDKTCRDVRQTAAIAFNDVRKLTEQLNYLDQHQLSTEKAHDAYRKQFDIGQRTLLDLLDTENELFQAKRAYTNAEFDLQIANARTQAGFGNLLATLELSRLGKEEMPGLPDWKVEGDGAEQCPPEAPVLYTVNKEELNARAAEYVKEVSSLAPAAAAGSAVAAGGDRELNAALKVWLDAWTSRDTKTYLSVYADSFKPADGSTRASWASKRQQVISAATDVSIDLKDIKTTSAAGDRAATTFTQIYRSAAFKDTVTKTLEWQKVNGKWLIVKETSAAKGKK